MANQLKMIGKLHILECTPKVVNNVNECYMPALQKGTCTIIYEAVAN